MDAGRVLVESFLRGRPISRPPFVPLLARLLARVEGVSLEAMSWDPALWSAAAAKTADLFDLDGIAVGADPTLVAEACGCPLAWEDDRPRLGPLLGGDPEPAPEERLRLACAIETARRTFAVQRSRRGCVGVLTGPVTLAYQLFGAGGSARLADAKQLTVRVAELLLKAKPDLLCLLETQCLTGPGSMPAARRAYATLKNVAAYFDVPLAVGVWGWTEADLGALVQLPVDLWLVGPGADGVLPSPTALAPLAGAGLGVGVALPLEDPEGALARIEQWAKQARAGRAGRFFFTSFEPPASAPEVDGVHRLVREIQAVRL